MSSAPIPWKHVSRVLVLFSPLWLGATVLFGVAGIGYSLLRKDTWSARQPLVVRDQAGIVVDRLGRFGSQTELKSEQETILEMAQTPEVVAGALRQIGPPAVHKDSPWPSTKTIDSITKDNVSIRAPKGAEFGDTEVFYLEVQAETPKRTSEFCKAMFEQVTEHHRKLRKLRADSIIAELTMARDLAKANLDEAADRMRLIEVEFGSDLGELRNLSDAMATDGTTRRALEETLRELQTAELELQKLESLQDLLIAGSKDPNALVVSGRDLLQSQPSLQRLKDGLIDAQLATSRLSGNLTVDHPKRRAATFAEAEIRDRIQHETKAVIRAMQPTLAFSRDRASLLATKRNELNERLKRIAQVRTDYAKIDAEVRHRTQLLGDAEKALTEAQANRTSALTTNLIAEFGPVQVSDKPIGPSGKLLSAGASMAGLIFGIGCVFLVAPGPNDSRYGRRWSDYIIGRRATDSTSEPVSVTRAPGPNADGGMIPNDRRRPRA